MKNIKRNGPKWPVPLIILTALLGGLSLARAGTAGAEDHHSLTGAIAPPEPAGIGMCAGQRPAAERDFKAALEILRELSLKPADEQKIIRDRGFTSQGLNCLFGKIMAGNDIFGWGSPAAYGIFLKPEELDVIKKYEEESRELKAYLEKVLNIRAEVETE